MAGNQSVTETLIMAKWVHIKLCLLLGMKTSFSSNGQVLIENDACSEAVLSLSLNKANHYYSTNLHLANQDQAECSSKFMIMLAVNITFKEPQIVI